MKATRLILALAILALIVAPMQTFAADGGAIFKAKCATCHGADGKGETSIGKSMKLKDLGSAEVQKVSDAALEKTITDGQGKMPAYKGKLAADEIKAVVSFIRTLKK